LEYWIADWSSAILEIYRRPTPMDLLELQMTLGTGDELTSPLLPGFVVGIVHAVSPSENRLFA
jgi:hypothetical protein